MSSIPSSKYKLLIHSDDTDGSTDFVDSSGNNKTISIVGDTEHSTDQSKFGGSSIFFDGNADSITLADSDDWTMGEGDFTIDFWIYPTAFGGRRVVLAHTVVGASTVGLWIELTSTGALRFLTGTSPSWGVDYTTTGTLTLDTWQHVALVRTGDDIQFYVDGTADATTGDATGLDIQDIAYIMYIGRYQGGFYFIGYLDEFRILKGTAAWTANFTPPTEPYTPSIPSSKYKLLIHSDDTDGSTTFVDSSVFDKVVTAVGDIQHSTTQKYFGESSIDFDGSGDYLTIPYSSDFNLGTDDFTIDFWINPNDKDSGSLLEIFGYTSGIAVYLWTSNSITVYVAGGYAIYTHSIAINNWYHIAITRESGTLRTFIDGTQLTLGSGSESLGGNINGSAPLYLGWMTSGSAATYYDGYMDEIRLLKGTAAWSGDFTPPTEPYTISTAYVAKSVILDIADNWGSTALGVRSIEFYLEGSLIEVATADITGYATNEYSATYVAEMTFDTSYSKVGVYTSQQWLANAATEQRLICVFDTAIDFDAIVVNNGHSGGTGTTGAKNTVITISLDEITSTTYEDTITNATVLFDGILAQHAAFNGVDDKVLDLIGGQVATYSAKSIILDIADDWGSASYAYMGIRSIEFFKFGIRQSLYPTSDYEADATSEFGTLYQPEYVFNTLLSKTGSFSATSWLSDADTEQRLLVVFTEPLGFDEIRVNNNHHLGARTDIGAKNVVINMSDDEITSTTYEDPITNATLLYDGEFAEHAATDTEEEETLVLTVMYDDFTGTDGDAPNTTWWDLYHDDQDSGDTSGTMEIQSNTLQSDIAAAKTFPVLNSNFRLSGDFDIQIDFSSDMGSTSNTAYGLAVGTALDDIFSGNFCYISRYPTIHGPYRSDILNASTYQTGGSSDTSGKFRIVRSGTTVTTYYWSGSAWTQLNTSTSYIANPVYVKIFNRAWDSLSTFSVNYDNFIVNSADLILWPQTEAPFTAKSVIFDIASDWGSASYTYMGVRSIDFWFEGSKITLDPSTDFVAYATSEFAATYPVESIFDTSLSKTGGFVGNEWLSAASVTTQRFNVVFTTEQTFDQIRVNNNHHAGTRTDTGIRSTVITISDDSITSTTYGETIANSAQIFDDDISQHVPTDTEDEETLLLLGDPIPSTTVLLIHSDNVGNETVFVDSSDSGHAITRSSAPVNTEDEQKIGGTSIYFDGADDLIYMADSVDLALLDFDFTFEFWVKCGRLSTKEFLCGQLNSSGATTTANLVFEKQADNSIRLHQGYGAGGSYILFLPGLSLSDTNWHHLCLERDGNTLTMYLDGVAGTTTQDVTGYSLTDQSTYFSFGRASYYTSNPFQGYMDEIRLVKKEAIYQGAFTPSITAFSPLQPDLNYKLLIHSATTDGSTTFEDSSIFDKAITASGNAEHSTDEQKFSLSSLYFDGASGLSMADSDDWDFSGEWTIDCWLKTTQTTIGLLFNTGNGNLSTQFQIEINRTAGKVSLYSNGAHCVGSTSVNDGDWHHIAYVSDGTNVTLYIDGTEDATEVYAPAYLGTGMWIGISYASTAQLTGYMDEVRILNGTAAWTDDFTPPTEPYTTEVTETTTYNVSGVVTEEDSPVARTVRAYLKSTGALLDSTTSDGTTGAYSFTFDNGDEVFIIAFDDDAGTVYNAVISDKITPS